MEKLTKENHKNLISAIKNKDLEKISTLINEIKNINQPNYELNILTKRTCLHYACWKGNLEIVKILITYGANINAKSITGKTALNIALDSNLSEIVQYIIENGIKLITVKSDLLVLKQIWDKFRKMVLIAITSIIVFVIFDKYIGNQIITLVSLLLLIGCIYGLWEFFWICLNDRRKELVTGLAIFFFLIFSSILVNCFQLL